ncbi:MAG: spore coat protein CotJB [Clostridia bacterium]|jgi:spore coat protein JB|nr:spore coat protein CotJB [Clostridia bacterium]
MIEENCGCNEDNRRGELLDEIRATNFSIIELGLYLDINPDDKKALCLYNELARKLRIQTDNYQKIYGPLTIEFPCNKWRWLEQPWPWEKGGSF